MRFSFPGIPPGSVASGLIEWQAKTTLSCVWKFWPCWPPQLSGALGQLGEEQAIPCAEHLFSQYGVGLIQCDGTYHQQGHTVCVELKQFSGISGSCGIWHLQP